MPSPALSSVSCQTGCRIFHGRDMLSWAATELLMPGSCNMPYAPAMLVRHDNAVCKACQSCYSVVLHYAVCMKCYAVVEKDWCKASVFHVMPVCAGNGKAYHLGQHTIAASAGKLQLSHMSNLLPVCTAWLPPQCQRMLRLQTGQHHTN